jgi:hypothetical protein
MSRVLDFVCGIWEQEIRNRTLPPPLARNGVQRIKLSPGLLSVSVSLIADLAVLFVL